MEGYAGLDSPPPRTYDYITFGPVTLRTSDPSDQCPFGPVTCPRFIDSVVDKVKSSGVVNMTYMSILLYADDILLVAPSVTSLQRILSICEAELESLDMRIS